MVPRRILLADADAFFVNVARQLDPDGAGRAELLIVGGSSRSRGVVTSASYPVRRFGVRAGMPMSRAVRLCPDATVVPVPMRECSTRSREIRRVLERFAPVVVAASVDEFYLDLGGTESLYGDEPLEVTAARIRAAVLAETALPVSIGGGTTRLVAKMAAGVAKPGDGGSGVHIVPPGHEEEFMSTFRLGDIPGVGPRQQERLASYGLHTVKDAARHSLATLAAWFGPTEAAWLSDALRGIDDSVVQARARPRSLGHEDTFPRDLHSDTELERELARIAGEVSADLREDGWRARTVTVKIKDADFKVRQASRTLPSPVESDRAVSDVSRELLRRLRTQRRVGVRLLGVSVSGLVHATDQVQSEQLAMFAPPTPALETERDRALSRMIDGVRARFGHDAISSAAATPVPRRKG